MFKKATLTAFEIRFGRWLEKRVDLGSTIIKVNSWILRPESRRLEFSDLSKFKTFFVSNGC